MVKNPYEKARERKMEKEIERNRKYVKKVWGKDIKLKKMSGKEIKKLGDELGMNVFYRKNFKSQYFRNKKNKIYMRVCRRCNLYHKITRSDGTYPRAGHLCLNCQKKIDDIKGKKLKLKNQNKWKQKILNVLKNKNRLTISEIAREIKCSSYTVRGVLKLLSKEKKIKIMKVITVKII